MFLNQTISCPLGDFNNLKRNLLERNWVVVVGGGVQTFVLVSVNSDPALTSRARQEHVEQTIR